MTDSAAAAATQLHARANTLRTVATRLEGAAALTLARRADHDTWIGPTPHRCLDDLGVMRRSLLNAVDDLRQRARILDTRAWALTAAAGAGAAVPVR